MNACEALHFVTDSSVRLNVLRAASEPSTLTELEAALAHSRRSIRKAAEWYVEHGWLRKQDERYSQTLIGATVIHRFDDPALLSREDVEFIASSKTRFDLLHFSSLPDRGSRLIDYCEASKSTAQRMMESLAARGWYEQQGQTYERTVEGDQVQAAFTRLFETTEQTIDKNLCLRWLGPSLVGFPIDRLDTATMGVNGPGQVDEWEGLFRELVDSGFDRYRGMISSVNNSAADAFSDRLDDGTEAELIITREVLRNLPMLGSPAELVKNGIRAPSFDMLITHQLPVTFSIFDDNAVFIAPLVADIANAGVQRSAVLVSADEEVVEWAITRYERQRDHAQRPSDLVLYSILSKLDPTPRLAGLLGKRR